MRTKVRPTLILIRILSYLYDLMSRDWVALLYYTLGQCFSRGIVFCLMWKDGFKVDALYTFLFQCSVPRAECDFSAGPCSQ
jgi:hypothetical protein